MGFVPFLKKSKSDQFVFVRGPTVVFDQQFTEPNSLISRPSINHIEGFEEGSKEDENSFLLLSINGYYPTLTNKVVSQLKKTLNS